MKEYTVDFESFEVEAETYDKAWTLATKEAYVENDWRLDEDLKQDEDQKPNRWTAVYNSLYVQAENEDIAWKEAEEFARIHKLDIIEMDEGYQI
tara:strand:+ start:422 stop:703 length:282 start_codon:yes stop_codon:yes gene_type:complete